MPISSLNGYTLNILTASFNPVDAQTIFYGFQVDSVITEGTNKLYIPKKGIIKTCHIRGILPVTAGSNEAWPLYIRINGITEYLVQSLSSNLLTRIWKNYQLSIKVEFEDYLEIKMINPSWLTNPVGIRFNGTIFIE